MEKNVTLFIVRDFDSFRTLVKNHENKSDVVFATDDFALKTQIKISFPDCEVFPIEGPGCFFDGLDDALKLWENCNYNLRRLFPNFPAYIVEMTKHIEGGFTTQRLMDIVLLVKSYQDLIERHPTSKIFLYRKIAYQFEDDVLLMVAAAAGVPVTIKKSVSFRLFSGFRPQLIEFSLVGGAFSVYLPIIIRALLVQVRFFLNIIVCKIVQRKIPVTQRKPGTKKIGFSLQGVQDKHVDNISSVMKAFDKEGYESVAIAWTESLGIKSAIQKRKLQVDHLENYISWGAMVILFWQWVIAVIKHAFFIRREKIVYKYHGCDLTVALKDTFFWHVYVEMLSRIYLDHAIHNYYSSHEYAAVKLWGEVRLDFGRMTLECLKKIDPKCILFFYPIGIDGGNHFGKSPAPGIHLYFLHGESDRQWQEEEFGSNSVVAGYPRSKHIDSYRKYSQAQSRSELGISDQGDLVVFYASSNVVRGLISASENFTMIDAIIAYCKQRPRLTMIFKPHPSESISYIKAALDSAGRPANIILFPKTVSVYHCIIACDLVLTKFSTVTLEAFQLDRPVISIALDGATRLQNMYEDAVEKFFATETLFERLDSLLENRATFELWRQERIKIQRIFLPRKLYSPPQGVEQLMVEEVAAHINRMSAHV